MKSNKISKYILYTGISCTFSLLLISCNKEPIVVDPPSIELSDSTLIWKVALTPDTLNCLSIGNIYYHEGKVITSGKPVDNSTNEILQCFDSTGALQWDWDNYEASQHVSKISDEGAIGSSFYFTSSRNTYCLDVDSGEENWRFLSENSSPRIESNSEDIIFKTIGYTTSAPRSDSTAIFIGDLMNGDFNEVFTIKTSDENGDAVHIPRVTSYENDMGHTILVFQNNTLHMPPAYREVIDLYSYNLTEQTLMWKVDNVTEKSWNANVPQMDEDNIYFATKYRFFSIVKKTGTINWERLMPHDFQGSNYILYQDLLITNLDNGDLIAIDKHTGETVWHNVALSGCCVNLSIVNHKLYFGNGDLFIIDPSNGDVLFTYTTPTEKEKGRGNANFLHGVAVDLERGRIYITDSYYLLCLKHPDL